MPNKKSNYNKNLKPYAQDLRNNSTLGEIILWKKALRAKRLFDHQFNRQYSMNVDGNQIIVDFICRTLKLIIEIDGYSHKFKQDEDRIRDQKLAELEYHVLRFTEQEVRHRIDHVVTVIDAKIEELSGGG